MQTMKCVVLYLGLASAFLTTSCSRVDAQLLSVDFGDRPGGAGEVQSGFDQFLLTTFPHTQTYSGITIDLDQHGASGLNDRFRPGVPPNAGSFDQHLLLTDFIFNDNANDPSEGFDITLSGLNPFAIYDFTIWSYDAATDTGGNPNRIADWTANGTLVLDDITSVGPTPTSNDTYRHTFTVSADASGEVLLEAREAGSQTGALINGLQLDLAPPPIVSTWDIDGAGSWQASASWDNSLVPAAQNQQAVFGSKISSPEVVVLESAVSVNRVEFNNSQKYAIFGPSQHSVNLVTDTLSNTPTLQVVQGGHQFQAAVNLSLIHI